MKKISPSNPHCRVCGDAAVHAPVVSGPRKGEPWDHAFSAATTWDSRWVKEQRKRWRESQPPLVDVRS